MEKRSRHISALADSREMADFRANHDPIILPNPGKNRYAYQRIFSCHDYSNTYVSSLKKFADKLITTSVVDAGHEVTIGYLYFGQFLAHDLTFMNHDKNLDVYFNSMNGTLKLNSVYGAEILGQSGNIGNQHLPAAALSVGHVHDGEQINSDLPRRVSGVPVIADERADNLLPLAQFNVLFLNLYNTIAMQLGRPSGPATHLDDQVRSSCSLYFQEAVWRDFLPQFVDQSLLDDIENEEVTILVPDSKGSDGNFQIPVEFSAAAFRFGHAMIRDNYENWNGYGGDASVPEFFESTFDSSKAPKAKLDKKWATNWARLFDFSSLKDPDIHHRPLHSGALAPRLASTLKTIQWEALPESKEELTASPDLANLAYRTLKRGVNLRLATAETALANANDKLRAAGKPEITELQKQEINTSQHAALLRQQLCGGETSLWVYLLAESEIRGNAGRRLGPLGQRIVAETLYLAICNSIPNIFARKLPGLIKPSNGKYCRLIDIVAHAGPVDPFTTNHQRR